MKQKGHVWAAAFVVLLCIAFAVLTSAESPSWWATRSVLNTNWPANDYAPVLAGQLKWMATNAAAELDTLPGGAGTGVHALVGSFALSNNYVPINLGQLKNTAVPFYQRLMEVGYATNYPWTEDTADDVDFAPAVLGQLKYAFDFNVSTDSDDDDLPDWWEVYWFGSVTSWTGNGDADVDELSNLLEYQSMTSPTNSDTDADGMPDGWEFGYSLDPLSDDSADDPDEDGLSNLGEYNAGTDPLNGGDPGFLKPVSFRVTTSAPWLYVCEEWMTNTDVYGHLNDMTRCSQQEAEQGRESCDNTYEQDPFHESSIQTYTTFFRGGADNVRLILDSYCIDGGCCKSYSGSLKLYRAVIVDWGLYQAVSDSNTSCTVTRLSSNEISWSVYLDGEPCGGGSGGCYPLQVNWRRPTNDLSMTPWIDILPTNHIFMCAGCSNPVTLTAQPYGVTSANYTWSITPSGGAYFSGTTTGMSVNVMAGNNPGDYIVQCRPTSNMNLCVLGSATVTVLSVDLEASQNLLTLKHDRDCNLEVKTTPATGTTVDEYRIDIKRTNSATWYVLSTNKTMTPWHANVAGGFHLRGMAKIGGTECYSTNIVIVNQFPTYAQIEGDADVRTATDTEWANTLTDCTETPTNQRRERGFWILLNTTSNAYDHGAVVTGAWSGPTGGASIILPPRPADIPSSPLPNADGATYSVASFHTHTPTTYTTNYLPGTTRDVGPSPYDNTADTADDVPGVVYDYTGSPAGSGSIPMGYPEASPAQRYLSLGVNRRTTP
ncbi:MAG TPA: hypothetical protein PLE77_02055 [Kiritimatiellia bacterium]|nr:hypothetical protein [Kiritimatiellia bacterium]